MKTDIPFPVHPNQSTNQPMCICMILLVELNNQIVRPIHLFLLYCLELLLSRNWLSLTDDDNNSNQYEDKKNNPIPIPVILFVVELKQASDQTSNRIHREFITFRGKRHNK